MDYSKKLVEKACSVFGGVFVTCLIISFWVDSIWQVISNSKIFLIGIFISIMLGDHIRNKK